MKRRNVRTEQLTQRSGQTLVLCLYQFIDDVQLVPEMPVDRSAGHPRLVGDFIKGCGRESFLQEKLHCLLDDLLSSFSWRHLYIHTECMYK